MLNHVGSLKDIVIKLLWLDDQEAIAATLAILLLLQTIILDLSRIL
jgi:hypothetical protein